MLRLPDPRTGIFRGKEVPVETYVIEMFYEFTRRKWLPIKIFPYLEDARRALEQKEKAYPDNCYRLSEYELKRVVIR
jgi:hypothetical protein